MSPDIHTDEPDAFEADLAARLGAATDTISADGVTRAGVDDRIAARRRSRARRQGGIVLAAAALVLVAGIGALTLAADEPDGSVQAGPGDPSTTVAPPTTCPPGPGGAPDPVVPRVDGSCPEHEVAGTTTTPQTTTPTETTAVPSTTAPTTTEAPPETPSTTTTPPTTTAPPTTTQAPLTPGQPCPPGSSPDCIDPEGDGSHVYLLGGAECMASPIGGAQCADLDGDGHAGYPDGQ